ncbi:MAG TPA: transcriptional repressor [Verrucomicrobiae bacterium]|nr:transcriptional repressor [Verrucomicrobiae bacterium]
MSRVEHKKLDEQLSRQLSTSGFRFTPQRQHVYDVLMEERDHPTAEEVFIRAKHEMPDISMATVYNCLDALVQCGMARQVNVDRGATRFCPNMREHCHFYCDSCAKVFDIDLPSEGPSGITLPKGFKAARFEIAIHGLCAKCAGQNK